MTNSISTLVVYRRFLESEELSVSHFREGQDGEQENVKVALYTLTRDEHYEHVCDVLNDASGSIPKAYVRENYTVITKHFYAVHFVPFENCEVRPSEDVLEI